MLAIFCLSFIPACASSGGILRATTNAVPTVIVTNVPVVSTSTVLETTMSTNAAGVVNTVTVTNQAVQTNYVTQSLTNWTTNVVYSVSPTLSTVISTAEAANTVTGPLDPFSGTITAILGLAAAGLGYYAKMKTKQAATHAANAATVINAVEGLAGPTADAVKAAIQAQSLKDGTATSLNTAVQTLTSGLNNVP